MDGQQTHASDLAALEALAERFGIPTGTGAAAQIFREPDSLQRRWHENAARCSCSLSSALLRASPRRRTPRPCPGRRRSATCSWSCSRTRTPTSTFAPDSPAPYLSQTLPSQGAFVPEYYGVTHLSLGNYIALVSGQGSNPQTQADCQIFSDFVGGRHRAGRPGARPGLRLSLDGQDGRRPARRRAA